MAADSRGTAHLDRGADGLGQDARRIPVGDRFADRAGTRARRSHGGPLRLAPARVVERRPEEPPGPARGDPGARCGGPRGAGAGPNRRHSRKRARVHGEAAPAHPGDDSGVPLPPARKRGRARDDLFGPDGHRGRDPRARAGQAGEPSRPVARAARTGRGPPRPAGRPVGDAEAAGGGGPLPRRRRAGMRAGGLRDLPRARPLRGDPSLAALGGLLARAVGGDLRADRGAGSGAPHDTGLRQYPEDGGTDRGPVDPAPGRGRGHEPPREPLARAPSRGGGASQVREAARPRGHGVARARHRRRRRRPGHPGRRDALDRDLPAARGTGRPRAAKDPEGAALPPDPRRAGGGGRAPALHSRGGPGPHADSGKTPRHPGAAGGRRLRQRGLGRDGAPERDEPRVALPRPVGAGARRGHRAPHRRAARAAPSRRGERPGDGHPAGAADRAPLRGRHPRHRRLPGPPRAGRHGRGNGQRGLGDRGQRRRHLPARKRLLAHPAGGDRRRARGRREGPASDASVLAGRGAGAHPRARRRDRKPARLVRRGLDRGGRPVAPRRVRRCPSRRGGDPDRGLRGRREARPRRRPHAAARHPRALLRRERRHAARRPCPLRLADQPRVGPRPAQAILRGVRLRAPGGGQRGVDRALARAPAQLRPRRGLRLPPPRDRARRPRPGAAGVADVRDALAVERSARAASGAIARRQEGSGESAPDAGQRPARRRVSAGARLPGDPAGRRDPRSDGSPDRRADDPGLPDRGDGCGRLPRGPAGPPRRRHRTDRGGHGGALGVRSRHPLLPALHLPGRRSAGGAAHAGGLLPPGAGRAHRGRARRARSGSHRARSARRPGRSRRASRRSTRRSSGWDTSRSRRAVRGGPG